MANAFNKEEVVLFEKVLEQFDKNTVMSQKAASFDPPGETMQRTGDTIWRPQPYIAETVDGLDITGLYEDLLELSVPSRTDHYKNVPWKLNALALRDSHYMARQTVAAAQALSAEIEKALALNISITGGHFIKRGALTGYDDIAECDTSMTEIGVQANDRAFFLNSRDYNKIASSLAGKQYIDSGKSLTALEKSLIGQYAGFDTYKIDVQPRIAAAAGGATTVNGANQVLTPASTSTAATGEVSNVDNRYQYLIVDNTAGVVAGDAFTLPTVKRVHMITKQDTGTLFTNRVIEVVNGTTLKVLAMIDSGFYQNVTNAPVDGSSLTWLNTVAAPTNVFWQGNSVEVVRGRLAIESFADSMAVMSGTSDQGVTITMAKQANIDDFTQKYRWTVFFGVNNLNPLMNGVMLANQT
jgi:hypothetical protein